MDFQPDPGPQDRISRLAELLSELIAERSDTHDSERKAPLSKMAFNTFKQHSSNNRDVFTRFYSFETSVMELQRTLQDFSNSVQHLGSSVGVVASAYHIRFRLDGILRLFRGNVSKIYPDHPLRLPPTRNLIDPAPRFTGDLARAYALVDGSTQALPEECAHLTDDLARFLKRIKEIPDFTDDIVAELLDSTIRTLSEHMDEWTKSLNEYANLDWPDVRTFIDELSSEMQLDIERLSRSVASFVSVGIPMIEHSQKRKANGLLNISTVATFFSGVTATALQYSLADNKSAVEQLVNFSWTSALVFSLASAVNSQVAYRWQVTAHSSPDALVPAWLTRWLTDAPLLFLVVSVVLFILGLVCFSFSAFGGTFIPITTSIFAGLSSLGLLIVVGWVVGEDLTYSRTRGHHWFREIISHPKEAFGENFSWRQYLFPSLFGKPFREHLSDSAVARWWRRWRSKLPSRPSFHHSGSRVSQHFAHSTTNVTEIPTIEASSILPGMGIDLEKGDTSPSTPFQSPPSTPLKRTTDLPSFSEGTKTSTSEGSSTFLSPNSASLSTTMTESTSFSIGKRPRSPNPKRRVYTPGLHTWKHADMLKSLRHIQLHHELSDIEVPFQRIMEFSPMGRYLAALCPNMKIGVWDTATMSLQCELAPKDGTLQQVAWRPHYTNESHLTAKDERELLIRSKSKSTIRLMDIHEPGKKGLVWHRGKGVEITSMCWMREQPSFLWCEGSSVFIGFTEDVPRSQQYQGKFNLFYDFADIIHDRENVTVRIDCLLVIPGDRFLILTVTLAPNIDDVSATSSPEHRVLLFNIPKMRLQTYFATFNDINQIGIAKSGMFVLINRRNLPPTVYELKNKDALGKNAWLEPLLVCEPPPETEFIGASVLASVLAEGGQTILASSKDGILHVWDRKFGTKIGELIPEDAVPGQTVDSVIWSQDAALLAIAYNKGAIRIYQVPAVLETKGRPQQGGGGGGHRHSESVSSMGGILRTPNMDSNMTLHEDEDRTPGAGENEGGGGHGSRGRGRGRGRRAG